MSTIQFTHRGINLGEGTKDEKIDRYIYHMGGINKLIDYFLANLKITEENISEIEVIEQCDSNKP